MSKRSKKRGRAEVLGYGDIHRSLIYVFPLFLAYELGLVLTGGQNGVDFLSRLLFEWVGYSLRFYVLLHFGFLAAFAVYLTVKKMWRLLSFDAMTPLLLESSIYALTLGSFIIFVMDRLLGIEVLAMTAGDSLQQVLVISLGAGVYEEMVFRLALMGGGGWLLARAGLSSGMAIFSAALVSSLLFALAHHVGPGGEAIELGVFVYRFLAGLVFAALFYFRSLAHAVYTHFLYDLYVLGVAS
jgi:hypothetical protein